MNTPAMPELLTAIRTVLNQARTQLQNTINHTMVHTYWQVGHLIVEHEQKGKIRANYGQQQIKILSEQLRQEFGKGFNERNLRNMRSFYLLYPIWQTVSAKLSWSHYCVFLRVENQKAREWYMKEAIDHAWSVRALERQIDKLYYERLLSSKDKQPVIDEANTHIEPLRNNPNDYLRDPYILEFLNLP